jgi:hypothetical protein
MPQIAMSVALEQGTLDGVCTEGARKDRSVATASFGAD